MNRRDFMKKLHSQLVTPWLQIRLQIRTMPTHIKSKIQDILRVSTEVQGQSGQSTSRNDPGSTETANLRKRKICGLCPYKKRRMTKTYCSKCSTAICGEHKIDFCTSCASKN